MKYIDIIKTCPFCGATTIVPVEESALKKWQAGASIQDAMPDVSSETRETLISGICSFCQMDVFKDDEEEEDVLRELYQGNFNWYLI